MRCRQSALSSSSDDSNATSDGLAGGYTRPLGRRRESDETQVTGRSPVGDWQKGSKGGREGGKAEKEVIGGVIDVSRDSRADLVDVGWKETLRIPRAE
jgi:hypothetical protein